MIFKLSQALANFIAITKKRMSEEELDTNTIQE